MTPRARPRPVNRCGSASRYAAGVQEIGTRGGRRGGRRDRAGLLELDALVHQQGGVAAVVGIMWGRGRHRIDSCSVHHQYSSASRLPGDTGVTAGCSGVPVPTTAAAASSWGEDVAGHPRTCAPSATRIDRTAVCTSVRNRRSGAAQRLRIRVLGADRQSGRASRVRRARIWCRPPRPGQVGAANSTPLGSDGNGHKEGHPSSGGALPCLRPVERGGWSPVAAPLDRAPTLAHPAPAPQP